MVKMLKKILMITLLKKLYDREKKGVMFMEIPTHFISLFENKKLEKIIKF